MMSLFLQELTEARPDSQQARLSVKYEKKEKEYPKFQSVHESNALKNWQEKMMERKKQQGYLASMYSFIYLLSPFEWREIFTKQSVGKCK